MKLEDITKLAELKKEFKQELYLEKLRLQDIISIEKNSKLNFSEEIIANKLESYKLLLIDTILKNQDNVKIEMIENELQIKYQRSFDLGAYHCAIREIRLLAKKYTY